MATNIIKQVDIDDNGVVTSIPIGAAAENITTDATHRFVTDTEKTQIANAVPNTRKVNGKALTGDITISAADIEVDENHLFVTEDEKYNWDCKADAEDIPTSLSDFEEDEDHRFVTDDEKDAWNNKASSDEIPTRLAELSDDSTHKLVTEADIEKWNSSSGLNWKDTITTHQVDIDQELDFGDINTLFNPGTYYFPPGIIEEEECARYGIPTTYGKVVVDVISGNRIIQRFISENKEWVRYTLNKSTWTNWELITNQNIKAELDELSESADKGIELTYSQYLAGVAAGTITDDDGINYYITDKSTEVIINASEVSYDNTESGITSANVQGAIDEINDKINIQPTYGIVNII